ncbi:unnamed protein product [Agarophyton chilense]
MGASHHLSLALVTINVASNRILPELVNSFSLTNLYDTIVALNPVVTAFWLTFFLIFVQLVLCVLTRSYAWNDRFWTFIPMSFALLYALHPVISEDRRTSSSFDLRLTVMAVLVFVWGLRLTYGSFTRGYYNPGHLDYRYPWLRANIVKNDFLFAIAYSVLVVGNMTLLLALVTSPFYIAWVSRGLSPQFTNTDVIATTGMALSIVVEFIADLQQQRFQNRKARWMKSTQRADTIERELTREQVAEVKRGFVQSGLFAWCRHPNYLGEIMIWFFFYLFSISPSSEWVNWTSIGSGLYVVLFQTTMLLSERILMEKYPAYEDYRKRVPKLIPSPFSKKLAPEAKDSKDE